MPCCDLSNSDKEVLLCEIRAAKTLAFLGVVYRLSGGKDDLRLMEVLSKVLSRPESCVFMSSDFNYPDDVCENFARIARMHKRCF